MKKEIDWDVQDHHDEIQHVKEGLKSKIWKKDHDEVKKVLHEWMRGYNNGTDKEAGRLLFFYEIWRNSIGLKIRNNRSYKEAAISCGIQERIEYHFAAHFMNRTRLSTTSLNLLNVGLYGTLQSPRDKEERLNELAVADVLSLSETGGVADLTALEKRTGFNRRTLRPLRKTDKYKKTVRPVLEFMKRILQR